MLFLSIFFLVTPEAGGFTWLYDPDQLTVACFLGVVLFGTLNLVTFCTFLLYTPRNFPSPFVCLDFILYFSLTYCETGCEC
jgi:hypothetical protein